MGTIFANTLAGHLPAAIAAAGITDPSVASSPVALHRLPAEQSAPIIQAYVDSLQPVFLFAVPLAVLALVIALILPQVQMRGVAQESARGAGDGFAVPDGDSEQQLEAIVARLLSKQTPADRAAILEDSGTGLDASTAWGLIGIHARQELLGRATTQDQVEERVGLPHGVLTSYYDGLVTGGLVRRDGGDVALTDEGQGQCQRVTEAWRAWASAQLREGLTGADTPDAADSVVPERDSHATSATGDVKAALERVVGRALLEDERGRIDAPVGQSV